MRVFANIAIVFAIGLIVGGFTADQSIQRVYGIGAINIGPWSAWPYMGDTDTDPYTKARATATSIIPLGAVEGLAFEAKTDSRGQVLKRECEYLIEGNTPTAQLWTLAAYGGDGRLVSADTQFISAATSENLVRAANGEFSITAADLPRSGNWLPLSSTGELTLILRLYDTPIISNSGLVSPTLPTIRRVGCRT